MIAEYSPVYSAPLLVFLLSVVRVLAVLSQIMLVAQRACRRLCGAVDAKREVSHPRQRFQNHRVMSRCRSIFTPRERPVVGHQHARSRRRIRLPQAPNDGMTSVLFIFSRNLFVG